MEELKARKRVLVGHLPTRRHAFSSAESMKYKEKVETKLREWHIDVINIDSLNHEGLIYDHHDVPEVVRHFATNKVDCVFIDNISFGVEDAVAKVAKALGKPVLLWGPRDDRPMADGKRIRDSQCGTFAASKALQRYGVPFSYIVSSTVDSKIFKVGFETFINATRASRGFLGAKIGVISNRPQQFYSVIMNEGELLERWAIEMVPISLVEIEDRVLGTRGKDERAKSIVEEYSQRFVFKEVSQDAIETMASLQSCLIEWIDQEGLSGIAMQCWDSLQSRLGIAPCLVNSEITSLGVPVACETDVKGALTSILVQNATRREIPSFFSEWTMRHPDNDNGELLWHCGLAPYSLREEGSDAFVGRYHLLPGNDPGMGNWVLRGGDVTIARLDELGSDYSLMMGHARGIQGPFNLGTHMWIEVNNWPLWEYKLMQGPYIHHVSCIHDKVCFSLYEATRFIPGLRADPIEPTEQEILNYLVGGDTRS